MSTPSTLFEHMFDHVDIMHVRCDSQPGSTIHGPGRDGGGALLELPHTS